MRPFQIVNTKNNRTHWCLAAGPATALLLVSRAWKLAKAPLRVYNQFGEYEGRWA